MFHACLSGRRVPVVPEYWFRYMNFIGLFKIVPRGTLWYFWLEIDKKGDF